MAVPFACIISLTPVTDEPRVIRQAGALLNKGWKVTVCGFKGRQAAPAGWRLIEVTHLPRRRGWLERQALRFDLVASRASRRAACRFYWRHAGYDAIYQQIDFVEDSDDWDLVIGHDYYTAPLAARIAERRGIPFSIDVHELAREQYMHDRRWVLLDRPWVHRLQKEFMPKAAAVTTICDGIAEALRKDYAFQRPPIVARSTALYQKIDFRPTGETIKVLYHGILSPMRGLEAAIRSVPLWRPEFHLIVRGNGPEEYISSLKALAEQVGASDRVTIDPPVLFGDLIRRANEADIGYFVQEDISFQKRFTLPNKLFEYIMAGLALCIADLPEMARVLRQYDAGRLVPGISAEQIAAVINSFAREDIDAYKRRSLEAAKVLCWENESQAMTAAYDRVLAEAAK